MKSSDVAGIHTASRRYQGYSIVMLIVIISVKPASVQAARVNASRSLTKQLSVLPAIEHGSWRRLRAPVRLTLISSDYRALFRTPEWSWQIEFEWPES